MAFNLDAYLARIQYSGERTPTVETLRAVHQRHVQTFPFENINPLMRWPVLLDPASLQAKMVEGGRGGYCYEQNLLLKAALEALGFQVTGLAARVLLNRPPGSVPGRTHMLLRINVADNSYLADAGFGRFTLTEPIKFQPGIIQPTSHERRRIEPAGEEFYMQAEVGDEWRTLYQFSLAAHHLADYQICSWYLCNHPASHFTTGLIAARPTPIWRYTLRNNELTTYDADDHPSRTVLTTSAELRAVLADTFLLRLPESAELEHVLESIAAGGEQ